MSNFQFLESHWTDLAKLGDLSEKYVYSDPNTSIIKQGMLSEVMVKYMLAYDGIAERHMIIRMPTELEYLRIMICYQERLITLCISLEKPEMTQLTMLLMKVKKLLIIYS